MRLRHDAPRRPSALLNFWQQYGYQRAGGDRRSGFDLGGHGGRAGAASGNSSSAAGDKQASRSRAEHREQSPSKIISCMASASTIITVFGSSRPRAGEPDYEEARRLGVELASRGFRSEEHTSELQSHLNLVCRLLLEKKKKSTESLKRIE